MKYFRRMQGDKVYLSPVNPEDFETYTKWVNDLSLTINLGSASNVFSLMQEKSFLESMAKEGQHFAIISNENDELIGNCSLFATNHIHRTAELGLFIGEEKYRNKGIGTEVVQLLLAYGFNVLNLNNIMLKVFEFNKGAIKAYEKAGFQLFGRRRQAYFINGRYYDELYMEILSKDFDTDYLKEKMPFDH